MLNSIPVSLAVGSLLGFLSGLGIGGGSLLMLWLTLILGLDQTTARGINLLFFIPSAMLASLQRLRSGSAPEWKNVIPAVLAGSASAMCFCALREQMDTVLLKKFFGVVLLAAGIREVFYKPAKK